jgi:hypothetical protein
MFDEWDALMEQYSRTSDQLRKPIDPEIFETVVALNVLGIPTVRSSGGHIDEERGLLLPWVDIEVSDPRLKSMLKEEERLAQKAKAYHQEAKRLQNGGASEAQIGVVQIQANGLYTRVHELQQEIRVLQAGVRITIADYLVQFYIDRHVSADRRLVLSGLGSMRLHNQGVFDCFLLTPVSVQRQKLAAYREEMMAFTAFLKQIYFSRQATLISQP